MKKLVILGLFLAVLFAFGASAAEQIDLGGKTSISATRGPSRGFSESFIITNNGDVDIADLSIQLVTTELSSFNITTSPRALNQQFALNVNDSVTITLTGTVPDDVNTKNTPYTGTLKMFSGSSELNSLSLNVIAQSLLSIDSVKVEVDGDRKSKDDGDTIKDVLPGSELKITGKIENLFTDDEDVVIEDVEIEIVIRDIDDDDDLEETEDVGDIDADDTESFSIEFEIPDEVDEDDYTMVITVDGEDEDGAKHTVEWELIVSVEKDKHDIEITKAVVSPSKLSCNRRVNLNIELKNQGREDEDEVVLQILSSDLDIDEEDTSIPEIEEGTGEDTEYSKTYTFEISENVKAGTYPITIKSFYETDELSNIETVDVIVEKCEVVEEEEEEPEDVVIITPPAQDDDEEEELDILTEDALMTTESSFFESNTYFLLLIGGIGVAVLVIIVLFAVVFSMMKKKP